MPDRPAPQPDMHPASCLWQFLGGCILISTIWLTLRLVLKLNLHLNSTVVWLALAGALPFFALSVVGGIALLRRQRRGCWPIWTAAGLSLFRWPFPYFLIIHVGLNKRAPLPVPWLVEVSLPLLQWLNVLVVALMLLGYWLTRTVPIEEKWRFRLRPVMVWVGILAVLGSKSVLDRPNPNAAFLLDQGNEAFEADQQEEAVALWQHVIDQYPYTPSWGMALFNTSLAYHKQDRWREAIPLLESLLDSDLTDTDPSPYLMNPYQNYHYEACMKLVDCYEHLADYPVALRFAKLARDVHPYQSGCLTCKFESKLELRRTITRLEQRIAGTYSPTSPNFAEFGPPLEDLRARD